MNRSNFNKWKEDAKSKLSQKGYKVLKDMTSLCGRHNMAFLLEEKKTVYFAKITPSDTMEKKVHRRLSVGPDPESFYFPKLVRVVQWDVNFEKLFGNRLGRRISAEEGVAFHLLVFEYARLKDMFTVLHEIQTKSQVKWIASSLCRQIKWLASLNVLHGDVKSENVLIDFERERCHLIDFDGSLPVSPKGWFHKKEYVTNWKHPEAVLGKEIEVPWFRNRVVSSADKITVYQFGFILDDIYTSSKVVEKDLSAEESDNLRALILAATSHNPSITLDEVQSFFERF